MATCKSCGAQISWAKTERGKLYDAEYQNTGLIIEECGHALLTLDRLLGRKPVVPDVAPLIKMYYSIPGNEAGGHMHVQLDDGNVEDFFFDDDSLAGFGKDRAGRVLFRVLKIMSVTQRRKAIASWRKT